MESYRDHSGQWFDPGGVIGAGTAKPDGEWAGRGRYPSRGHEIKVKESDLTCFMGILTAS